MRWWWVSGALSLILYATALTIPDWGREFTRFGAVYAGLLAAYGMAVVGVWRSCARGAGRGGGSGPRGSSPEAPVGAGRADALPEASAGPRAEAAPRVLLVIWLGAIAFRVLAVAAPPTLSDDMFRYVWDGRVLLEGINPYRYAPLAEELAHLRGPLWASINNPALPTIYPPVLMLAFAAAVLLAPAVAVIAPLATTLGAAPAYVAPAGSVAGSIATGAATADIAWAWAAVTSWKLLAALFDLGAGWFLMQALRRRGRSPAWAALYLWHPLVVIEFAGNGHADAVGVFFVCVALAGWYAATAEGRSAKTGDRASADRRAARRWMASGVALTLAGLVKFLPWVALPALIPKLRARWLILPVLVALAYLPFQLGGVNALGSLGVFASKWRANDFLFAFLLRDGAAGAGGAAAEASLHTAKILAAAGTGAVWLAVMWRRRTFPEVYSWAVGAALLLSPVVHPWYVIWLLPVAILLRHPAWWIWSVTVVLAYAPLPAFRAGGPWTESMALKTLEYAPVLAAVLWQVVREMRGRRQPSA